MPRRRTTDPNDPARARLAHAAAAIEFGVPDLDITQPHQRAPLIDYVRQVAMYLSACSYGMTMTRIGELFGRDRTTVSHAIRVIEDGRTDPVLDAKLERLESWLCRAPRMVDAR
ncbi:MAG: helix-turn-helix domain-containing protein [Pseudomonadota bacterium]